MPEGLKKYCQECAKSGHRSRLKLYQINFEEAIPLCENETCIYPLVSSGSSVTTVKRHISSIRKRPGRFLTSGSVCTSPASSQPTTPIGILRGTSQSFKFGSVSSSPASSGPTTPTGTSPPLGVYTSQQKSSAGPPTFVSCSIGKPGRPSAFVPFSKPESEHRKLLSSDVDVIVSGSKQSENELQSNFIDFESLLMGGSGEFLDTTDLNNFLDEATVSGNFLDKITDSDIFLDKVISSDSFSGKTLTQTLDDIVAISSEAVTKNPRLGKVVIASEGKPAGDTISDASDYLKESESFECSRKYTAEDSSVSCLMELVNSREDVMQKQETPTVDSQVYQNVQDVNIVSAVSSELGESVLGDENSILEGFAGTVCARSLASEILPDHDMATPSSSVGFVPTSSEGITIPSAGCSDASETCVSHLAPGSSNSEDSTAMVATDSSVKIVETDLISSDQDVNTQPSIEVVDTENVSTGNVFLTCAPVHVGVNADQKSLSSSELITSATDFGISDKSGNSDTHVPNKDVLTTATSVDSSTHMPNNVFSDQFSSGSPVPNESVVLVTATSVCSSTGMPSNIVSDHCKTVPVTTSLSPNNNTVLVTSSSQKSIRTPVGLSVPAIAISDDSNSLSSTKKSVESLAVTASGSSLNGPTVSDQCSSLASDTQLIIKKENECHASSSSVPSDLRYSCVSSEQKGESYISSAAGSKGSVVRSTAEHLPLPDSKGESLSLSTPDQHKCVNLFIQWQNKEALCWLDVVLCILSHSPTLQGLLDHNSRDGIQDTVLFTLLKAHHQAQLLIKKMMRKNCQISPVPFNSSSLPVNTQVAVLGNPKAREPLDFVSRGETSEKSLPESAIFVPQTGAGADIAASKINAGTCSSDKGQSSPLASKTDTTKMSLFEVNGSQLSPDCDKNAGASILPDSVNEAEKLPKKSSRTAEPSVSVLNDMKDNLSSLKCASSNTAAVVNTNATNINCTVLKTDASSSPAQANGILSDNRHISVNRFAELFYSIDVMNVIREKVWKVLQPRLRCERGKNDSPVFALPLLVRDHPSLKKMFKMEYTFSFRCEICSYKQEDSHFKILPSFPAVPADFTMKEPCFVRNCFQCNAPNQRMKMEFKTLPNVLLFHFMQGLPHNRFADLDFSFHGDQYTVTAFVQYKHNPDHFVAWVRNGSGNQWMECDDLKSQLCRFQQGFPDIPCGQIHIMMLEKNLTDSSVKLLEDTATSKLLASLLMVTDGLASSSPNQSCGSPSMNMKAQKESGFKQTGVKYIVTSPNTSCLQAGSSGGALMSGNLPSVMPAGVSVVPRSVSVPLKAGTLQATLSPGLQAVAPRGLLGGTSSLTSSLPVQGHQNVRIVVLNSQGGVTNAGVLSNVSSGLPVANLLQSCQGVCNTQGDTSVTNTCADVNQDVKVLTPQKRKDPDTKLINDLKLQGSSLCSPAKRSKVIRKQVAVKTGSPQVNVSVQPSVLPSSAPTRQIIIKTFNSQGQEVKTSNMGHVDISRLLQTNTDSKPNITSALLKHLISGSKPNVAFSPSKIVIPDVQQPAEIKSPGQLGGIIQQQTSVSLPGVLNSTTGSLSNAPCLNKVTTVKSSAGSGLSLQQLLVSVSKSRVSNQNASNAVSHGQHQHAKVNSTADASNTVSQAPVSTVSVNTEADQSSGNPVDRTSLAVKTSSSGHVLHVNSAVSAGNLLKMTQFYQGSKARPVTVRKTHTPNLLKCSKTAVVTSDGLPTQNAASQITSQPVSGNNMSPPTSVKHPALLLASSVTNITQIKPVASTGTISIPPAVSGGRVLSSPLVVSQTPASTVSVQSEASKDSSAVTQYLSSVLKTPQRVDKCVAVPLGKGVDTGVKVSVGQPSSTRTNKIVLTKQNALSVLKAAFTGKPPESYLEAVKPFLNINVGDTGGTTIKQKSFEGYRPRNTLSDQVSEASSVDIPASDSRCANQTGLLSSKVLNKEPLPQGRARGRGSVVVVSKNKPPSVQIAPPSVGVPPPVATSSVETMTSQNHLLQGTQGKDDDVSPVFSPGPSAASLDNYYVVEQSVGKPGRGRGRGRGRGQGRGRGRGRARVKTSAAGLVTVGTADVMSGSSDQAPAVVGDITTLGATTMFHTAVASPGRTLSMQTRKGGHTSSHEPDANKINNQSVIKTQNSKKGSQTLLKNSHYYIVSSAEPSLTGNMCAALQRPGRKRKAPPFPQKLQVKSCKSVVSSITGDAQTDKNMTSGNSEESKVLQNLYEALNLSPPPSYGANRNSRLDVGVSDVESNTVNIFENGIPVNDINPDVYMSGDFMMDTDESLPSVAENVEI